MTIIDTFHLDKKKIAILGDLLIDTTYYIKPHAVSPEAPILSCELLSNEPIKTPGGAGLAAAYASKNKIPHVLLSLISDFNEKILSKKDIEFINLSHMDNIEKTRYIDEVSRYQLLRLQNDKIILSNQNIDHSKILKRIKTILLENSNIKVLACLDYRKGLFTQDFCRDLILFCKDNNIKTYADTRDIVYKFKNIDTLKLNEKEYESFLTSLSINSPFELIKLFNLQKLIITKGKNGATIYKDGEEISWKCNQFMGIVDVTGCGDVFDINFCFYYYIERFKLQEALMASVYAASKYADTSIETRL